MAFGVDVAFFGESGVAEVDVGVDDSGHEHGTAAVDVAVCFFHHLLERTGTFGGKVGFGACPDYKFALGHDVTAVALSFVDYFGVVEEGHFNYIS